MCQDMGVTRNVVKIWMWPGHKLVRGIRETYGSGQVNGCGQGWVWSGDG